MCYPLYRFLPWWIALSNAWTTRAWTAPISFRGWPALHKITPTLISLLENYIFYIQNYLGSGLFHPKTCQHSILISYSNLQIHLGRIMDKSGVGVLKIYSKLNLKIILKFFTFCALRFPPLDNSFIVLGEVTPTWHRTKRSRWRWIERIWWFMTVAASPWRI